MITELGKRYLQLMKEGKVCNCVYLSGLLCDKCIKENRERKIFLDRNKKINKIFGN